jgi:hypothetical protein
MTASDRGRVERLDRWAEIYDRHVAGDVFPFAEYEQASFCGGVIVLRQEETS